MVVLWYSTGLGKQVAGCPGHWTIVARHRDWVGASGCLAKCLVTEGVGPGNILVAGLTLGVMLGPCWLGLNWPACPSMVLAVAEQNTASQQIGGTFWQAIATLTVVKVLCHVSQFDWDVGYCRVYDRTKVCYGYVYWEIKLLSMEFEHSSITQGKWLVRVVSRRLVRGGTLTYPPENNVVTSLHGVIFFLKWLG